MDSSGVVDFLARFVGTVCTASASSLNRLPSFALAAPAVFLFLPLVAATAASGDYSGTACPSCLSDPLLFLGAMLQPQLLGNLAFSPNAYLEFDLFA